MESPATPKGGEANLERFSENLLEKLEKRRGKKVGYQPVSNEDLIKEIQQARVRYNYDYRNGVPTHRINEFITVVEDALIESATPQERIALLRARQAHKDWATVFENEEVKKFRKINHKKPISLYQSMLRPDVYNILKPILENEYRGEQILKVLQRNMLEMAIEPYLLNPKSFNPAKFERKMSALEGIIPEDILQDTAQKVFQNHHQALNSTSISRKLTKSPFEGLTEKQIISKLRTIQGLKELEHEYSKVPGGKEKYNEIEKTMGLDLLFGGQYDIPARADRIKKLLNDRNARPYLKKTLGEENVAALDELVKKNELEKRIKEIEESPTLSSLIRDPEMWVKGAKVLVNIFKGNGITSINQSVALAKKIGKKMKQSKGMEVEESPQNVHLQ